MKTIQRAIIFAVVFFVIVTILAVTALELIGVPIIDVIKYRFEQDDEIIDIETLKQHKVESSQVYDYSHVVDLPPLEKRDTCEGLTPEECENVKELLKSGEYCSH